VSDVRLVSDHMSTRKVILVCNSDAKEVEPAIYRAVFKQLEKGLQSKYDTSVALIISELSTKYITLIKI
jgi:hypothetical protein